MPSAAPTRMPSRATNELSVRKARWTVPAWKPSARSTPMVRRGSRIARTLSTHTPARPLPAQHAEGAPPLAHRPDHPHAQAGDPDQQAQGQEALHQPEEAAAGGEVVLHRGADAGGDQALGEGMGLQVGREGPP